MELPLEGIRVIDMTSVVMGPVATQLLADRGADVIVIEDRAGDVNRAMGPGSHPDLSGVAMNLLRNKRSVCLDVKDPRGYEALGRLVAGADVFVTNLRPGSRRRAGLTYEALRRFRHDLVHVAAAGYPEDSDRADDPAFDDVIQGGSGVVELLERAGLEPALVPTIFADKTAGLVIANAVTTALFHRERTGEGSEVVIAMSEVMRSFLLVEHGSAAIPEPPLGPPGYTRVLNVHRRPQRTADGRISVLAYSEAQFRAIFALGGREDLADERIATAAARIAHGAELYRDVADVLGSRSTAEWLALLRAAGVPCAEVGGLDDLVAGLPIADHPHAGGYRVTPPLTGQVADAAVVRRPAPLRGEHGREVLAEVGYTDAELDALERDGVLSPCPG